MNEQINEHHNYFRVTILGTVQAFSQDLKNRHLKCAMGSTQMNNNIYNFKYQVKKKTIVFKK